MRNGSPSPLMEALRYAAKGWAVFPAIAGTKKPYKAAENYGGRQWGYTKDEAEIRTDWERWPDANICFKTGRESNFFVLDIDTGGDRDGMVSRQKLEAEHGPLPGPTVKTPSGGLHYYFNFPTNFEIRNSTSHPILGPGIDVRGEGGMVLGPPSVKGEGQYEWVNNDQPIPDAPQWLLELLLKIEAERAAGRRASARRVGVWRRPEFSKIAAAMKIIPNELNAAGVAVWPVIDAHTGWEGWNKILMALFDATDGSDDGYQIALEFSRKCPEKFNEGDVEDTWYNRYRTSPPRNLSVGTLYAIAEAIRPGWQQEWDRENALILPEANHMERARIMQREEYPHLVHYRDDFMDYDGGAYSIIEDGEITAGTWSFLDKAKAMRKESRARDAELRCVDFRPNRTSVAETIAALKAVAFLNSRTELPCWLDGRNSPSPKDLIAFPNGLLDVNTNVLHPLDPCFLTTASLGFDYSKDAAEPENWLQFLDQIFAGQNKDQQIVLLQEIFGYMLICDVSLEKAFLLLGPKRSGKGTIAAVLRRMLSSIAVIGPSLVSLGTNFGLTPLIGKQLAIIDDLRIGSPKEQDVLIENLLKITGRGLFTIDRKFKSAWTGSLLIKLLLISNLMPKLGDDSVALASRFITLITKVSFYGREDPNLLELKLMPELPGIFLWSLKGLKRLRKQGRFTENAESEEAQERFANLGSPARTFIAEYCVLDPNAHVEKQTMYECWKFYATQNSIYPGNLEKFCESIYAATGGVVRGGRSQQAGERINVFMGIKLREREQSSTNSTTDTDIPL